jgi:hypothetical protein
MTSTGNAGGLRRQRRGAGVTDRFAAIGDEDDAIRIAGGQRRARRADRLLDVRGVPEDTRPGRHGGER